MWPSFVGSFPAFPHLFPLFSPSSPLLFLGLCGGVCTPLCGCTSPDASSKTPLQDLIFTEGFFWSTRCPVWQLLTTSHVSLGTQPCVCVQAPLILDRCFRRPLHFRNSNKSSVSLRRKVTTGPLELSKLPAHAANYFEIETAPLKHVHEIHN